MIRTLISLPRLVLAVAAVGSSASSQALNVDLYGNSAATIPSAAYGAAADQPGVWNGIACSFCEPQQFPLVNLTGQPTTAALNVLQGGFGESCTDATLSADEAALLRSGQAAFDQFTAVRLAITGLESGEYDLYVYAGKRCTNIVTPVKCDVTVGSIHQAQDATGGATSTLFELDGNCMRFRFQLIAGQILGLNIVAGLPEWFSVKGLQLVKLSARILPMCFGANDGYGCPCGPGAWGSGCPSSFQPAGASLVGSGGPSVAADSVVLHASGLPNSTVLVFQGTALQQQGAGSPFGYGLLCAGGTSTRMAVLGTVGGAVQYPEPGDTAISVRGFLPPTGGRRLYQVLYRDSIPSCSAAALNCTNGVLVTWGP